MQWCPVGGKNIVVMWGNITFPPGRAGAGYSGTLQRADVQHSAGMMHSLRTKGPDGQQ